MNTTRLATSGASTRCTTSPSTAISHALEGITHSLCTLEFQDNRCLYDWVLDNITICSSPAPIRIRA
ncbi:glutamate--tRNA ligase family protein [Escherichia coli]